jgi:hypothetical protein
MVATTILLDSRVAPRTLLGVSGDPIRRLGVIFALLQPHFDQCAGSGLMVGKGATKAKFMVAKASHSGYYTAEIAGPYFAINGIFAVWSRTPFEIFDVVDVCASKKFAVSVVRNASETTSFVQRYLTYLSLRSFVTSRFNDFESTIRLHLSPGHWIRAASPSSLIFCARYCR